jgi:hypothetical protein
MNFEDIKKLIETDKQAVSENRREMLDDQKFAAGEQWPDAIAKKRQAEGRPIQTINRLPAFIDQVVGDARQNRPSIKVHPAEDGDVDIANIYDGLIRAIQNESNADFAYDTAIEHTATFGFGAWRIKTDYESHDTFNQIILIERIVNPLNVYFDKNAQQPDYSDARHVAYLSQIPKDEYKKRWPKAEVSDFKDFDAEWLGQDDCVVIAEFWYKEDEEATLYLVQDEDGNYQTTLEKPPVFIRIVDQRKTYIPKVKMCICSGSGGLEESDWAGQYLPIVGVNGKEDLVDGKRMLRGLVRFSKDAQRMYNYWRTVDTEQKALAPKAPVLVSAKQIEGLEDFWQKSLTDNLPYLVYNPDPIATMPQRLNAGIMDKGANEAALMCVDEMKSTTGIYSASLGEQDNEKSGRAILAQQRKGDTANFAYFDNVSRAIRYTGRAIIDLIPKIYDSARVVQIMGADGEKKLQRINQLAEVDGQQKFLDLSAGKYDLVVTQGSNYATKRIEALNSMVEIARVNPAIMQIAGDLIIKAMDWDGADEIAERMKKMLPPQLQDQDPNGLPPEVQGIIEQGKAQIDELTAKLKELESGHELKEDELRLKKYEIDVKAELELAKLSQGTTYMPEQVQDIVNRLLMNAASQPELEENEQEQPEIEEMPNGQEAQMQIMQQPIELEQQTELPPDLMLPNLTNNEQDNIV